MAKLQSDLSNPLYNNATQASKAPGSTFKPITVIAGKVGYTNTSKFSEAFKKVKGKTPLEYRKIKI